MIDTIEKLLQDYASYGFMEGTIDEDTMNHLVEDAQNYVAKLNELNLLSLHLVSNNEVALKAFLEEFVDAWEDGMGGDTDLYRKAKSLL